MREFMAADNHEAVKRVQRVDVIDGKRSLWGIYTVVKKLWKVGAFASLLQASGFLPVLERPTSPLSPRAPPVWNWRPTYCRYESAGDCLRLGRRGQEKNR